LIIWFWSPSLDQLIVKQKIEALEAISGALGMGFETQNKYKIKNSLGQVSRSNNRTSFGGRFLLRDLAEPDRPFFSVNRILVRPGALKLKVTDNFLLLGFF
jgi:hypothetical protein